MQSATPNRLGDFEIVRELGRGGMGVVFEARQMSLNRKVALKVLSGSLGLTGKAVERFRREAEAAARLHHTNIVPIYATGEADGTHFYAMELIDGPSLDHVIRNMVERADGNEHNAAPRPSEGGPEQTAPFAKGAELATTGPYVVGGQSSSDTGSLTSSSLNSGSQYFDTVARMIADVADALEHAHQNGVVHRDIKPSNLLLSSAGRLSINDFGLARMLEQPGMTMTGEFVGTPAYMSPEQITAGRAPLNHRTDIYSLGATLYELLTLRRPFAGDRRDEVIAQIMHKEPKAPRQVNAKVPVDLETICLKCMEKDPDRRYQTAAKLAEDLRCYVNRFAISARRAGMGQRVVKWARRQPALTGALACALLLALMAGLFAYRAWRAESQHRADRRQYVLEKAMAAAMVGDLDKADKAIAEATDLGISPDQIRMLRGQMAYYSGDTEGAIDELKRAVDLDRTSAAARGLLAVAYSQVDDWHSSEQTLSELKELTPRTTEDYLFKGYAEGFFDAAQGLKTINETVNRSLSPLAHAIRANVRLLLISGTTDPDEAKREAKLALVDIEFAKKHLADNPFVLATSLSIRVNAANLYRDVDDAERKAHLEEAKQDVKALDRWKALPIPFLSLWNYYDLTEQEQSRFDATEYAAQKSQAPIVVFYCAWERYRRGKLTEALEVLKK